MKINPGRRDLTIDERLTRLESAFAQLLDQVWWMNLATTDPERRKKYEEEGFTDPIPHDGFYND